MIRNYDQYKTDLQKAVRNFNRKIDRLARKDPGKKSILPEKITAEKFRQIEQRIGSKRDFNREINRVKRFSKRGAETPRTNRQGFTKTRWEVSEAARTNAANNRRKAARQGSIKPSTETGTMGLAEAKDLQPKEFNYDKFTSDRDFHKFVEVVEKQVTDKYEQEKLEQYKENYLKAIAEQLGDGEMATRLLKYIEQMSADRVFKGFNADTDVKGYRRDFLSIIFTYNQNDKEAAAESILDNWRIIAPEL